MNKRYGYFIPFLFLVGLVFCFPYPFFAQVLERIPVAISPGQENRLITVMDGCPTFSWSAVEGAAAYRLAVFSITASQAIVNEESTDLNSPVLRVIIPGNALSWTPSAEERLLPGQSYTWYVQALDADGSAQGMWSAGTKFRVATPIPIPLLTERVSAILKAHGVQETIIKKTSQEVQHALKEFTTSNHLDQPMELEDANNTCYGLEAGASITSGTDNAFFGRRAGKNTTTPMHNTFLGYSAGSANSTGYQNVFVGHAAGTSNTTGQSNVFVGSNAGVTNTTGIDLTFVGCEAGNSNTTGSGNTFIGYVAGQKNTTGFFNTCLGNYSGQHLTTGCYNTFLGTSSGKNSTTGNSNVFLGGSTGPEITTGANNLVIGDNSARFLTTGNNNTIIGNFAGWSNTIGQGNIFLGNEVAYNETASNTLYIDHSDTSEPLLYGKFDDKTVTVFGRLGLNTKTPLYTLEANTTGYNAAIVAKRTDGATAFFNGSSTYSLLGSASNHPVRFLVNSLWKMRLNENGSLNMVSGASLTAGGVWTNASSRLLKENITTLDTTQALTAFSQLTPVEFNYKNDPSDRYVGFIAEDVPELVATHDRSGLSPMDINALLTRVLQEQRRINQRQQDIINDLQQRITNLEEIKKQH